NIQMCVYDFENARRFQERRRCARAYGITVGFLLCSKGVVASVIKRLIDKLEQTASETLINILIMLDNKGDEQKKRIDKQDERLDDFEDKLDTFQRSFDGTKAEVDSNVDMKKGITKAVINAIIVGVIAWILSRIGIGG